ncbi:MAG: selenium metabolism-associated LysR family transcriptional regulator [Clostridiales bacterium]
MININLKQLEAFIAAVEFNNFTRAAEELYLSQSTISAHIGSLEQALGVSLFDREAKKKIHLTTEGKNTYLRAKDILNRCEELKNLGDQPDGPLLIGASTVPAQNLLPAIMSDFLHQHDKCRYLLKRGNSEKIHALLQSGEVRIGFVGAAIDAKTYQYHTLVEDELVLVTAENTHYRHLWEKMTPGYELLTEPLILREDSSGTLQALQTYLNHIHCPREKLHIVARSDNPEAIKNMVSAGMGVSVLSALAIREEITEGKLLSFPLDSEGVYRKIQVAYRRDKQLSRVEKEFITFALKEVKKNYHRIKR